VSREEHWIATPMKFHAPRLVVEKTRSDMVAKLKFTCEKTGGLVAYELPNDVNTVKHLWNRRLSLNCPHCGHVHGFAFRPAFIRGALDIRGPAAMRVSEQMAR
jgi:hypothetical protein